MSKATKSQSRPGHWKNNPYFGAGHTTTPITEKTRQAKSKSATDDRNSQWKGDKAGYFAIHKWVARRKPKPEVCEHCKSAPPRDLANISGEYKRDVNDFQWLCRRCHMIADGRMDGLKQFQFTGAS